MEDTLYIIAFISTVLYCWNVLADCSYDNRPNNPHLGYALISLFSIYQIYTALFLMVAIGVLCYTAVFIIHCFDKPKNVQPSNN